MARKLLFLVSDGNVNNLLTTMMVATEARESGCEVSVVVTEAALPVLVEGRLTLAPPLEEFASTIRKNLKEMTAGKPPMYDRAKEAGVSLYVSEMWVKLLGLVGEMIPPPFEILPMGEIVSLICQADAVIGKV